MKAPQILHALDGNNDTLYKDKVTFLVKLINQPYIGHIIDSKLVPWAIEEGFKPKCNFEDGTSWWTCQDDNL
ncbi:MAG: hypothetical protein WC554_12550 [Clostridia bacterium]|jgi:hypothetical protein